MRLVRSTPPWLGILLLASCSVPRTEIETMQSLESPAFLVATSKDGETPEIRVTGHVDWERTRPITEHMHLRIGSVTKLFVGNLVLILRDEGKLDIDAPIGCYVKGVPQGDRITLRQLANHTTGCPTRSATRHFKRKS